MTCSNFGDTASSASPSYELYLCLGATTWRWPCLGISPANGLWLGVSGLNLFDCREFFWRVRSVWRFGRTIAFVSAFLMVVSLFRDCVC